MVWPLPLGAGTDAAVAACGLMPLLGVLCLAVASDLCEHRIPNVAVLAGMAAGLLLHSLLPGGDGFLAPAPGGLGFGRALQGLALGAAALLPLYALRAAGPGDVKLMAAVGAILGPDAVVPAIAGTFVAGGVLSLAVALSLSRGGAGRPYRNLAGTLRLALFRLALPGQPLALPAFGSVERAPYAVAVALGTLGSLVWALAAGTPS